MEDIRFNGRLNYRIEDIGFVMLKRNEDFHFEYRNGKDKYSFIFVETGKLEYTLTESNKTILIEQGSVLFMPKELPYKTKYTENNTVIKMLIFDVSTDSLPAYFTAPFTKSKIEIKDIFDTMSRHNVHDMLFLLSKIYELIYLTKVEGGDMPKAFRKILPAVNEIKHRYFENEKIAHYAALCHMSESNFRKLFKEQTGYSPIEYRNAIRISQAKKIIESGECTVSEAAFITGFNNMSFFYEVYKKYAE